MKKILVQIDGSNFYHIVKKILPGAHLTSFGYRKFIEKVVGSSSFRIVYYVGEIKQYPNNKKSQTLYSHQQKLFASLRKQGIEVKLGFLLFSGSIHHEKGVDVQIAVDMVRGAIKNEYDICYLISSDTDLLPAIQTSKEEGKTIIYVGFENFISRALLKNCISYKRMTIKDLAIFSTYSK